MIRRIGGGTYEETAVKSLAPLALDGVMGCSALGGVGAAGGLALDVIGGVDVAGRALGDGLCVFVGGGRVSGGGDGALGGG